MKSHDIGVVLRYTEVDRDAPFFDSWYQESAFYTKTGHRTCGQKQKVGAQVVFTPGLRQGEAAGVKITTIFFHPNSIRVK